MLILTDETTFFDINKSTNFNQYINVNNNNITIKFILNSKETNLITEYSIITINTNNRFFRIYVDQNFNTLVGQYNYNIELLNQTTLEYDKFEYGLFKSIIKEKFTISIEDEKIFTVALDL